MSCWIAVHDPQQLSEDVAAMRVHGFYGTTTEARAAARAMAVDQPDVYAYIIDECTRWIRVTEPVPGTGEEEEEVAAPENEDPTGGRMGSVCNLRNRVEVVQDAAASAPPGVVFEKQEARASRTKDSNRQRTQLEHLLRDDAPTCLVDAPAYAAARERYALLRAFERRLETLLADGLAKCHVAMDGIRALDDRHPEYHEQYQANYERALRESGMRLEDVTFRRFLERPFEI
jgi:hypothetical protein